MSRTSTSTPPAGMQRSNSSTAQSISSESSWVHTSATRESHDSLSSFPASALERKGSSATTTDTEAKADDAVSPESSSNDLSSRPPSFVPGQFSPPTPPTEPSAAIDEAFVLPPPPSDIPDDYGSPSHMSRLSTDTRRSKLDQSVAAPSEEVTASPTKPKPAPKPEKKRKPPLSEGETAVAVELMCKPIVVSLRSIITDNRCSRRRQRALYAQLCMANPTHPPCRCKDLPSSTGKPSARRYSPVTPEVYSRQQPIRFGNCRSHL